MTRFAIEIYSAGKQEWVHWQYLERLDDKKQALEIVAFYNRNSGDPDYETTTKHRLVEIQEIRTPVEEFE
jgi:hypothetical protein